MGKSGQYKIPFNGKAMLEWSCKVEGEVAPDSVAWAGYPTEWRENLEFEANLRLLRWGKGRSSARVFVKNQDNQEHYSFALGAFYEAVTAFGVTPGGHMKGKFTFRKQGSNYGLYPVVEK